MNGNGALHLQPSDEPKRFCDEEAARKNLNTTWEKEKKFLLAK